MLKKLFMRNIQTEYIISEWALRRLMISTVKSLVIFRLPNSLGPIYKIQLWHNNAGPSPGWFLSRVTIKDVNSGRYRVKECLSVSPAYVLVAHRDCFVLHKVFFAMSLQDCTFLHTYIFCIIP